MANDIINNVGLIGSLSAKAGATATTAVSSAKLGSATPTSFPWKPTRTFVAWFDVSQTTGTAGKVTAKLQHCSVATGGTWTDLVTATQTTKKTHVVQVKEIAVGTAFGPYLRAKMTLAGTALPATEVKVYLGSSDGLDIS